MKAARLLRWSGSVLSPRTRPDTLPRASRLQRQCQTQRRTAATAAARIDDDLDESSSSQPQTIPEEVLLTYPSPPISAARASASLSALHARLSLPTKLPLESLARCLVDSTADRTQTSNNAAFSQLGSDLLSYYASEYIICQFPRLPLAVVFAAMSAYIGPRALASITREWGVQPAAAPGGEVDPSFLQFKYTTPGAPQHLPQQNNAISRIKYDEQGQKRTHSYSARTIHDDAFGEPKPENKHEEQIRRQNTGITLQDASTTFVQALMGAIYLHSGRAASKKFFQDHFASRQLNMASLISFRTPTKDLSKLCAREGFEAPIARILSETGRLSRAPVFIVGVFSGKEKLGDGAGSSLDEARTRAAVAALKGWYLYSPLGWQVPSDAEDHGAAPTLGVGIDGKKAWESQYIDVGDVVI